jgi:hypothetical protein
MVSIESFSDGSHEAGRPPTNDPLKIQASQPRSEAARKSPHHKPGDQLATLVPEDHLSYPANGGSEPSKQADSRPAKPDPAPPRASRGSRLERVALETGGVRVDCLRGSRRSGRRRRWRKADEVLGRLERPVAARRVDPRLGELQDSRRRKRADSVAHGHGRSTRFLGGGGKPHPDALGRAQRARRAGQRRPCSTRVDAAARPRHGAPGGGVHVRRARACRRAGKSGARLSPTAWLPGRHARRVRAGRMPDRRRLVETLARAGYTEREITRSSPRRPRASIPREFP